MRSYLRRDRALLQRTMRSHRRKQLQRMRQCLQQRAGMLRDRMPTAERGSQLRYLRTQLRGNGTHLLQRQLRRHHFESQFLRQLYPGLRFVLPQLELHFDPLGGVR